MPWTCSHYRAAAFWGRSAFGDSVPADPPGWPAAVAFAGEGKRCRPGDAGAVREIHQMMVVQFWSRAHKAHVSTHDVEKLRQLVEFVAPEEAADPCNARIPMAGAAGSARSLAHRPELENRERQAMLADALLPEDCRTPGGATNQHTDTEKNRSKRDKGKPGSDDVKDALEPRATPWTYRDGGSWCGKNQRRCRHRSLLDNPQRSRVGGGGARVNTARWWGLNSHQLPIWDLPEV
jgi:hypothetical protein